MRGSLAYRQNEPAILAGRAPEKYTRILPHIPEGRVLELGSAEGVLACLLAREGREVTALERNPERHAAALRLAREWGVNASFESGDIRDRTDLLAGADVLVAVRMIYYLRETTDQVCAEVAKHVPVVVLCGNRNRADNWRRGTPHEPLGDFNRYASREGMKALLERHGYRIEKEVTDGDEIVVGVMD